MKIGSPIFIVESHACCWFCHSEERVIALATSWVDEEKGDEGLNTYIEDQSCFVLLTYLQKIPEIWGAWLEKHEPDFQPHFSQSAGLTYYANICRCGANFGDHFLHGMDGPFSPMEKAQAKGITLVQTPFEGEFEVECLWAIGGGDLIFDFAPRR